MANKHVRSDTEKEPRCRHCGNHWPCRKRRESSDYRLHELEMGLGAAHDNIALLKAELQQLKGSQ